MSSVTKSSLPRSPSGNQRECDEFRRAPPLSRLSLSIFFFLGVALHVGIHLPFLFETELAEPDAGRLVLDAWMLATEGPGVLTGYRVRSSPAYLVAIAFLLKSGIASLAQIPGIMTFASLLSGALVMSMFVLLIGRWFNSVNALLVFWILMEASPVFWQASIAGFPTIVSMAFFVGTMVFLDSLLFLASPARRFIYAITAAILFLLATLVKVDALALTPGLIGMVIYRAPRKVWVKSGLAILVISAIVFVIGAFITQYYAAPQPSADFWQDWDSRWPMTFQTLFSVSASGRFLCGAGLLMPLLGIGALTTMLRGEALSRRLAVFLLCWALPATLFWMSRPGGARHFLTVYFPLAIAASWLFASYPRSRKLWFGLGVLVVANYFIWPPSADTLRPSGRLLASTHAYYRDAHTRHQLARQIAEALKTGSICIHNLGEYTPYFLHEACALYYDQPPKRLRSFEPAPGITLPGGLSFSLSGDNNQVLGYSYSPLKETDVEALENAGIRVIGDIHEIEETSPR